MGLSWLMLVGCGPSPKETTETTPATKTAPVTDQVSLTAEQLRSVDVQVTTPRPGTVSGKLTLQGQVAVPPQGTISVSFPLGGYLKSTDLLVGLAVRKGQVLAQLEDLPLIQLQQDYLTAKEQFILAVSEFNRQKELNATKASSDKVYQQARTELESGRIQMNALGRKLELIGINPAGLKPDNIAKSVALISPINGIVSKVNVNIGKYAAPTDVLFELVDLRDVHLVLNVFEKDLSKLAVGQRVAAFTNEDPEKKWGASILLIGKNLNADRMAEVQCHFERYNAKLVPGTFMNGEVAVQNKQALTVPEAAVVRWANQSYVFTQQREGCFKLVPVTPGASSQGKQQIKGAGITPQTPVVTKNAYTLLMKLKNAES